MEVCGEFVNSIDWNLLLDIDLKSFLECKDEELSDALLNNYLESSTLFSDPDFFPKDLVTKFFIALKVPVKLLVEENERLRQIIAQQNNTIKKMKQQNVKKVPAQKPPTYVFVCPYCEKQFETSMHVHQHISRRHSNYIKRQSPPLPVIPKQKIKVKRPIPQPSNDNWQQFEPEMKSMLDFYGTLIRREQESIRTDFLKQFKSLEEMVQTMRSDFEKQPSHKSYCSKQSTSQNDSTTSYYTDYDSLYSTSDINS